MAEADRLPMSDAEREVLKVLWDHGPLGVKDVLAKFTEAGQEWSRSTVITLLQRLEKKGYVRCDKSQFAFVFEAAVSREDEMRARMNDLASELCDGETLPLVLAFAQQHQFTANELAPLPRNDRFDQTYWQEARWEMNELVWWFGQNTLAALLMIPCVVLACRLFRDRPAVQHLLWLVILLKFVTPPVVVWPWSVDELQRMAWPQLSVQQGAHQGASLDPSPAATMSQLIEPRSVPFESAVVPTVSAPSIEPSSPPDDVLAVADNANEKAPPTTPTNWKPIVATTAILAWFIGAIGCAFSQLRRLARYARLVRNGEVAPPHLKAEVASVASLLSMKAPVCVIVKGGISPFLWCAGSARLAWPDSLSSQADVVRSRGIIAHELAHLRRCDHWITWLELGASILWWWNPLFWYVRRQLRETAEMSCDALAIAAHPESRREYAELLLRLSSQSTNEVPVPVIAMGACNAASFEKRLKMILSSNVSGNLSWRGAVAIAVLAVIALPYWSLAQSTNLEPSPTLAQQSDTAKESRKATEARSRQRLDCGR